MLLMCTIYHEKLKCCFVIMHCSGKNCMSTEACDCVHVMSSANSIPFDVAGRTLPST